MQQMHCNALFCHDIGLNVVYYMITYHCSEKGPFLGKPGPYMNLFYFWYPSWVPIYISGFLFSVFWWRMSTQFQGGINCASSQVHFARSALCTVNYDLYALVFYLNVDDEVFLPVSAWKSFLIKNLFSLLLAGIKSTRCQGNHNFVLYLEHKNQNFTLESGINIFFTDLRCHWGKNKYSFFLQ